MRQLSGTSMAAILLVTASTVAPAGLRFDTAASGAQEVSPPAPAGGVITDTGGTLRLQFNDDLSQARFDLRVSEGRGVTQAHLHCGRAGENVPVVAFLFGFVGGGVNVDGQLAQGVLTNDDLAASDCVSAIGRPVENIASLAFAAREGSIYVNVHTVDNAPGEVRGQLIERDNLPSAGRFRRHP